MMMVMMMMILVVVVVATVVVVVVVVVVMECSVQHDCCYCWLDMFPPLVFEAAAAGAAVDHAEC